MDYLGGGEGDVVGIGRDMLNCCAVQGFRLKENDWILAAQDGGQEEAFGLRRRAWDDDAETRDVREEGFRGLSVIS